MERATQFIGTLPDHEKWAVSVSADTESPYGDVGELFSHNADEPVEAASINKLAVSVALWADRGLSPATEFELIEVSDEDRRTNERTIISGAPEGYEFTPMDLCNAMLRYSDNVAWRSLVRHLEGPERVNELLGYSEDIAPIFNGSFTPELKTTRLTPVDDNKFTCGMTTAGEARIMIAASSSAARAEGMPLPTGLINSIGSEGLRGLDFSTEPLKYRVAAKLASRGAARGSHAAYSNLIEWARPRIKAFPAKYGLLKEDDNLLYHEVASTHDLDIAILTEGRSTNSYDLLARKQNISKLFGIIKHEASLLPTTSFIANKDTDITRR